MVRYYYDLKIALTASLLARLEAAVLITIISLKVTLGSLVVIIVPSRLTSRILSLGGLGFVVIVVIV